LFRTRKNDGTLPLGTVNIFKTGSSPAVFPTLTMDSTSPTWATDAQSTWNGTVRTSDHGVTRRSVPAVGSTSPDPATGYYVAQADVVIVNDTITDGDGDPLTVPPGTITGTTTMYNLREGKTIKMTNLDLGKLAGYYDINGDGTPEAPGVGGNPYVNRLPANGLLYATRPPTNSRGSAW
jgi:hypothetical protein